MTSLVDRTITALRANHDQLVEVVAGLDQAQVTGPSAASDWTVAEVLSHLGSGAEITRHPILAAAGAAEEAPTNQEVWDRWNAMSPADQATGFLGADGTLVASLEALTPEQRETLQVDLGFLPQPVPLATALGMRLNEQALHSWDVRAGLDPTATLGDENATVLAEHLASSIGFLLRFIAKPEGVGPARVGLPGASDGSGGYTVVVAADGVTFAVGADDVTATFTGPFEAGIRLLTGRLKPPYQPDGVQVHGDVTLADLRRVFPGY